MCASGNKFRYHSRTDSFSGRIRALLTGMLLLATLPVTAVNLDAHRVEDLRYGRALFEYFQDNELGAITLLMIAEQRPRSREQVDEANLLLADLYYDYGLYEDSRQLFARLLTAEVSDSVQNRIWFNLARLRFDQGYYDHARDLLSRINDRLPARIEAERQYLLTNLYLGNRQYDQAADLSNQMDPESIWKPYARYNLGVTMLEDDHYEQGRFLLDQLGQTPTQDSERLALRDQANLSLGLKQLRLGFAESALESLSRIRLEGPLSHAALLASGWAWYRLDQFDKALIPWRVLLRRNAVDPATQEAILAIPSNYAKAGQYRLALRHYEIAAQQFDAQLQLLDQSIESIKNDSLIAALQDSSILYDRSSLQRLPPSSDVTPQLHQLLASTEFHREVKRYHDLLDIRQSLRYWGNSFPALELMLEERRQGFAQKLPMLQRSTSFSTLATLRERRDRFAVEVEAIARNGDYTALANLEERDHLQRLQRVADSLEKLAPERNTVYQQDMFRLLSGLLHYELATDFPGRFWQAKKQLIGLDRALEESSRRTEGLRRITQRAELEFDEFEQRIDGQLDRIRDLRGSVANLLQRQEQRINRLAIGAIEAQQEQVLRLRLNARFELAKLYDKLAAEQQ